MLTIFLGAPGSGKGTISDILVEENGFKHISTGNIFRNQINSGTELGNKVKAIIEGGNLVDDETTWEVAKTALLELDLQNDKIILDGYPRNIKQNEYMNAWLIEQGFKDVVPIYFEVSNDMLLKRLTGRRMCKTCGKIYHTLFMPPKIENICDIDGNELYQREDDKLENVQVRLDVYENTTKPLIDQLIDNNSIHLVNAEESDKDVIVKNVLEIFK